MYIQKSCFIWAMLCMVLWDIPMPGLVFADILETNSKCDSSLFDKSILLGAHRGGKGEWPENTLVALKEVAQRWPNALLEVDAICSSDGHAVLMHDVAIDRTTNGSGLVTMMSLDVLKTFDAAYHFSKDDGGTFPYRGKGITIPTLQEALESIPTHRFLIEMKEGVHIAKATAAAIHAAGASNRCVVASVNPEFLETFRKLAPEVATCYDFISAAEMISALRGGDWETYKPNHSMLALSPSLKRRFDLTKHELALIKSKGILTCFFTINTPEEMEELLRLGVDSILTDYPSVLAEVIEKLLQN